jgi:hypothetical protein
VEETMKAHDLAKKLLALPDAKVVIVGDNIYLMNEDGTVQEVIELENDGPLD